MARVRGGRVAGLLIALLAGVAAPAALAATTTVTFTEDQEAAPYEPSLVDIAPGETVSFTGAFENHPLRWEDGDFSMQSVGTERTYTFPRPGTYRFVCNFHSDMTGRVRVAGNQVAVPDFTFSPAAPAPGANVTFDASAVQDPNPGGTIARYEWDLDGNGSFEKTGPAAVVTKAYADAGTVGVRLRVVDDGHDTSTTTSHDVVVAARPGGTGGGGTGGGTGGGATGGGTGGGTGSGTGAGTGGQTGGGTGTVSGDRQAPTARLTTASSTRAIAVRGGVAVIGLRLDEAATISATLRAAKSKVVLGRGTARVKAGTGTVRVKLTKVGLTKVKRGRRTKLALVITSRDAASNARTVTRALTLKR